MKKLMIVLAFVLSGCATVQDVVTSPKTFAVCKTADIATTAVLLKSSAFAEGNGLVAATLSHGYFPLIAISYGLYKLIGYVNNPVATAAVNILTGAAVVNNSVLLLW